MERFRRCRWVSIWVWMGYRWWKWKRGWQKELGRHRGIVGGTRGSEGECKSHHHLGLFLCGSNLLKVSFVQYSTSNVIDDTTRRRKELCNCLTSYPLFVSCLSQLSLPCPCGYSLTGAELHRESITVLFFFSLWKLKNSRS